MLWLWYGKWHLVHWLSVALQGTAEAYIRVMLLQSAVTGAAYGLCALERDPSTCTVTFPTSLSLCFSHIPMWAVGWRCDVVSWCVSWCPLLFMGFPPVLHPGPCKDVPSSWCTSSVLSHGIFTGKKTHSVLYHPSCLEDLYSPHTFYFFYVAK